jgi:chemotaxis-related protein WspB
MMVLMFSVGGDRYALSTANLIEVLPLIELRATPGAPPAVAGLFNYRGCVTPVLDLNLMLLGAPCPALISSRILLTRYALPDGRERMLGLRVERASQVRRIAADTLVESGLKMPPWQGRVTLADGLIVQLIEPGAILPETLREVLFPPEDERSLECPDAAKPAAD